MCRLGKVVYSNCMAYTTRQSLLDGMRQKQDSAREEFRTTYAPLIRLVARKKRLTNAETEELEQDVCVTMVQRDALGKYNPEQGRFRTYLGRIINNCAVDLIRKRPSQSQVTTRRFNSIPAETPEPANMTSEWEEFLLGKAMEEVRSRCDDLTFLAFDFHVRQKRPAKEVAQALGISEQKVYLSSSRITQRLKEAVERLGKELDKP